MAQSKPDLFKPRNWKINEEYNTAWQRVLVFKRFLWLSSWWAKKKSASNLDDTNRPGLIYEHFKSGN